MFFCVIVCVLFLNWLMQVVIFCVIFVLLVLVYIFVLQILRFIFKPEVSFLCSAAAFLGVFSFYHDRTLNFPFFFVLCNVGIVFLLCHFLCSRLFFLVGCASFCVICCGICRALDCVSFFELVVLFIVSFLLVVTFCALDCVFFCEPALFSIVFRRCVFWCTKQRRKTRDKTQFPWVQKEPETAIHSPTLLCSLKPSWYECSLRCFMLFVRRGLVQYIYISPFEFQLQNGRPCASLCPVSRAFPGLN